MEVMLPTILERFTKGFLSSHYGVIAGNEIPSKKLMHGMETNTNWRNIIAAPTSKRPSQIPFSAFKT